MIPLTFTNLNNLNNKYLHLFKVWGKYAIPFYLMVTPQGNKYKYVNWTFTALKHQGMDFTRPLNVSCGIWHQDISSRCLEDIVWWSLHGSDLLVQHNPSMLNWIEIWGNLESKATLWTLCHLPQTIPEQTLQCGGVHYPAERGHSIME